MIVNNYSPIRKNNNKTFNQEPAEGPEGNHAWLQRVIIKTSFQKGLCDGGASVPDSITVLNST